MQSRSLSAARSGGAVSLRVLIPFLLIFSAGLYRIVGLPQGPDPRLEIPDPASLEALLRSSRPPLDGAIYLIGILGWAVWGWLVISLLLQLVAAGAERVAAGTAAVRRFRTVADVLSVPLVRKAVQASLAGSMVVRVALPGLPVAAAGAPHDEALVVIVGTPHAGAPWPAPSEVWGASIEPAEDIPVGSVVYTVQPGDNLARIADRFYADGDRWHVLYEANQGRRMEDGRTFDRAGVIQPGWRLIVPEPTEAIHTDVDGRRWYTVRQGDSLAGISARLLGDEQRWPELFAVNEGVRLDERRVLRDPRLIWPGLRLQLPQGRADSAGARAATVEPPPSIEPASATEQTPPAGASAPAVPVSQPAEVAGPSPEVVQAPPITSPIPTATEERTRGGGAPEEPERLISPAFGAAAGVVGASAALAGGALILRRRHHRRRRNQPESDVTVAAGFAEADPAEQLARGLSGDDLATAALVAARFSRALGAELMRRTAGNADDSPLRGTSLAAVRHGRSSTTLMLQQVPMAARAQVIACLAEAATRAFGERSDVEGMVSRDGDVLVRLTGVALEVQPAGRDDDLGASPEAWPAPSLLLGLGLLADRQVFAANWDALSHVLVAAPVGQGADSVLGALLASLVAQRSPAELGLVVVGSPRALPEDLLGLPHVAEPLADPLDEHGALNALTFIREELERRITSGQMDGPDLVLVVPELHQLSADHTAALGPVMLHGPRYRVRVLAGCERRALELIQHCPILPEFGTRLVLRAADEEESVALLGSGDATELGPGGHLLVRLERRVPVQALGYRIAPDRLARLATLIRGNATAVDWWRPHQIDDDTKNSPTVAETPTPSTTSETRETDSPSGQEPPLTAIEARLEEAPGRDFRGAVGEFERLPLELPHVRGTPEASDSRATQSPEVPVTPLNGTVSEPTTDLGTAPPMRPAQSVEDRGHGVGAEASSASGLPAGRPRLRARFLGARELLYDGKLVWPLPGDPDEAAMELLVFLGVQDPSGVRAEVIGDSFWEEDDDEARADRLKKRRYRLRLALKRLVPTLEGDPLARMDKQHPVYRLNPTVIETDVHRFLKLVEEARSVPPDEAVAPYEEALELYRGDLLDRADVPPYRWLDEGPRLLDLRVKYARLQQQARRRLADLLASGTDRQLARAEELYIGLAEDDPLDHRLWEALARLHGRRSDLLGLEATARRLRSALVELGEGEDPERVPMPPALERVFVEVRASLVNGQAA